MYVALNGEVAFGDVFRRDCIFHDAHLRSDAANVGSYTIPDSHASRFASGIAKTLNREVAVPDGGLRVYSAAIPLGTKEDGLLAHGLPTHAIVLSDDCDIEDAFGRHGAKPRGRLLFAAVTERAAEEIGRVAEQEPFDRFPLPAGDSWIGGVVELRRLFMVDVRAVSTAPAARVVRLGPELSVQLAVTWAAYATRRGPLVAAKNAEKLAHLMASDGIPDEAALAAAKMVAQAVAATWTFEVQGLDAAAVAFDEASPSKPAEDRLTETLRELAACATAAADQLEALRNG